ncbi:hypothetical protein [Rhodoferax antarcticus]|uniref:hypothetical protein n=1 Tax=Rhodoferax antarcticus TaxID=81479 RepID=UPI0022256434|nr:hypothetical protein [Rhodoferax antarcticus]MCW2310879.1 hypothetical protein [Rhodoferax antarcticus]
MSTEPVTLKRIHARRLRDVYRSAGWPYQDVVEVDLLATGLLERVNTETGHGLVRVTDAGLLHMAGATQANRQARSPHEALVDQVVESLLREGRIAWTALSLRARVALAGVDVEATQWKICQPDVFSIRNSSRQDLLEPVVHEIKVSRADLLGDLKRPEKRGAYLDVGSQCWYVLGCDSKGQAIAEPHEIPVECGVMVFKNKLFEVTRMAPKRTVSNLPFWVWMELAKATAKRRSDLENPQVKLQLG